MFPCVCLDMLLHCCFSHRNAIHVIDWPLLVSQGLHHPSPEGLMLRKGRFRGADSCLCRFRWRLEGAVTGKAGQLSLPPGVLQSPGSTTGIIITIKCEWAGFDKRQQRRDADGDLQTHLLGSFKGAVDTLNPDCSSNSTHQHSFGFSEEKGCPPTRHTSICRECAEACASHSTWRSLDKWRGIAKAPPNCPLESEF